MSKNQAPWKRKYGRTLIAKLLHTLLLIGVFEFQYVAFGEDGVEESLAGLILVGDNVKTATASEFTLSTVRFMDGGNLVSRVGCQALYSKGEFRDVTVMNSQRQLKTVAKSQVRGLIYYLDLPTGLSSDCISNEVISMVKERLDEMRLFVTNTPQTAKILQPRIDKYQAFYTEENGKRQKALAAIAETENKAKEEKDFQIKCDLLQLNLIAKDSHLAKCESAIKELEGDAPRKPELRYTLLKWNDEKQRVIKLRDESISLYSKLTQSHPEIDVTSLLRVG